MYVPEDFESLGGLRREYAQSKARHLEEVRREAREAEEQAQLLQQDLQRKVRGCLLHKLRGVASPQQGLPRNRMTMGTPVFAYAVVVRTQAVTVEARAAKVRLFWGR